MLPSTLFMLKPAISSNSATKRCRLIRTGCCSGAEISVFVVGVEEDGRRDIAVVKSWCFVSRGSQIADGLLARGVLPLLSPAAVTSAA